MLKLIVNKLNDIAIINRYANNPVIAYGKIAIYKKNTNCNYYKLFH